AEGGRHGRWAIFFVCFGPSKLSLLHLTRNFAGRSGRTSDSYYVSPQGRKFRSLVTVHEYMKGVGEREGGHLADKGSP
ncbi:hypothetical protein KFL_002410150, partial [Klebsormidium nitens]